METPASVAKPILVVKLREHARPLAAFLAGILYDVLTLGRIDDVTNLVQQAVWLALLAFALFLECQEQTGRLDFAPWAARGRWWKRLVDARSLVPQFLFGGLLSAYAFFYLKSADGLASWFFVGVLAVLLVLNETPYLTRSRASFRFALFTLCTVSFFIYLWPILLGWIGRVPFVLGVVSSALVLEGLRRAFVARGYPRDGILRMLITPGLAVIVAVVVLYLGNVIPPVPLSLQKIGIYHGVEKTDGQYRLSFEAPWWKFWWRGDEVFVAQPGDRIFVFTRVFAPRAFRDEVRVRWQRRAERRGGSRWEDWDSIPLTLVGGRENGFRGFAFKSNFEPGRWKVSIETSDGREIGSMRFDVENDPDPARIRAFRYQLE